MNKVSKKLLLVLIPLLIILIGCLTLLIVLPDNASSGKIYVEQIKSAREFVSSGEYDKAVLHYREAIENDKTNEEAYLELSDVYRINLNDLNSAIAVLRTGYENTGSDKIHQQLITLQATNAENNTEAPPAKKGTTQQTIVVNTTYTDIFSTYDFNKYSSVYTLSSENPSQGLYIVKYSQIDAEFEYNNNGENKTVDTSTRRPFAYARPSVIRMNDISLIFPGAENGITQNDLKGMNAENIKIEDYNDTLKTNLVSFDLNNLHFVLGCDAGGNVTGKNCYNQIIPEPGDSTESKVKVNGTVIDVTTGKPVEKFNVIFHKGKNSNNGEKVAEAQGSNGAYEVELASGDYTAEIIGDNYNTEFTSIYVPSGTSDFTADFSISPKLAANQVRFVLEWGSTPSDLDSHLEGYCNTGGKKTDVDISFINKRAQSGSETIAELDIDDIDGFGPETITLHNTNGHYEYKVHRYSNFGSLAQSGATVKIYTSNSSNPITLTVPDDVNSEWWTVCTVDNGEVKDINGKEK